ncbi:MAG TPA: 4Fe-4S binding protein [Methanoregulaceae archaeon]|nr:4Fe-4S binding protein [Methanoregulaceae archaeon]
MVGPGPNPLQVVGIVYAVLFVVIAALLWRTGRFSRTVRYLLLIVTVLFGFLFFSPMLPHQFQELVLRVDSRIGFGLLGGLIGIGVMLVLTFLFGRHFCGYLCPIGALQELAYAAPVPKVRTTRKRELSVARGVVFLVLLGAGLGAGFSLLSLFGLREFFTLTLSTGSFVFAAVLIISLFLYRPFCRVICPLGVLFQLATAPGWWKLRRTDACINCHTCERACPTGEAHSTDLQGECYLCRRCVEACPVAGALIYGPQAPVTQAGGE